MTRLLAEGTLVDRDGEPRRVFVVEWTSTMYDQANAVVVALEPLRDRHGVVVPAGALLDVLASLEGETYLTVDAATFVGRPET